jgi:hypothetical protein
VQRLTASISCEPEPVIVTETVPEKPSPEERCPEEFFEDDHPGRGHDEEGGPGGDHEDRKDEEKGKDKDDKHDPCPDEPGPDGLGEGEEEGG